MQKKITALFVTTLFIIISSMFINLSQNAVYAQENQDETDTTPTTTEKLKERIEKIVEQRKDKVEQVLGNISSQKKGFIGQVSRVSETTLTLDVIGTTRVVPFDKTVSLLKNTDSANNTEGKETSTENISVDNWALVMGMWEDDTLTPRKIIIFEKSPRPDTHIVSLGSLQKINKNSIKFQARGKEEVLSITLNNNTNFEDFNGEEATVSRFTEEDQALVVGYKTDKGSYATTIRALAPFSKEE